MSSARKQKASSVTLFPRAGTGAPSLNERCGCLGGVQLPAAWHRRRPPALRGAAPLPVAALNPGILLPALACRAAASVSQWRWRTGCRAGSLSRCRQTRLARVPRNVSPTAAQAVVHPPKQTAS